MGCPRCRQGEDSIESKIGNVRRRLKSKDSVFFKSSLSDPLTVWVTDGLKTCEKWQNRKTKLGTSALNIHNAQNRAKRCEEVLRWAPQAAVTHGLLDNNTCVTAVTDWLQSEAFRTFMCFNAPFIHISVIFGIPYISHPSACQRRPCQPKG